MRFNHLPHILAGTAFVAAIVINQPVMAKTAKEVAKIAVPTTVRIDNLLSKDYGGSGVIIGKKDNTYTVLTANHVVENPNAEYSVYTSKGKTYSVKSVTRLPKNANDTDLAIITFESPEKQAVAAISNSDEASIGSGIYIAGYPLAIEAGGEREFEFTAGQISSRPNSRAKGYTMRYDAVTRRGMSGGPVFDVNGRVIGIHGEGDVDGAIQSESAAGGEIRVKTGLNAAIPINTFVALMPQAGMNTSILTRDDNPADNVEATQPSRQEVRGWYGDFKNVVDVFQQLRRVVPVRLPFGF
ncbi:trypsin-like peptidase domain-containing protein [Planktothrix sp. FACHB-1355]|uniref:Serine protease n=2 Tax=Oscillatoriophycideae TaxID=1301283 RepID=A0A926VAJ2_9CYAN|nr:serine protease [Aerosakkonema funiforme]MBD2180221.1 trypsin-like peptidase domain-containing protein [Aerosakkonema funiforme FACHB-1375]MBD3560193.1 trypsin-like peptidase domain-containing protein [Planktothrix sp. FACHB-1355]